MRKVASGKIGLFSAAAAQLLATSFMGLELLLIALAAQWLAGLAGFAFFISGNGGNDGTLVGLGVVGLTVSFGTAALFAAVMLFHALTAPGSVLIHRASNLMKRVLWAPFLLLQLTACSGNSKGFSCGISCYTNMRLFLVGNRILISIWGRLVSARTRGLYELRGERWVKLKGYAGEDPPAIVNGRDGCRLVIHHPKETLLIDLCPGPVSTRDHLSNSNPLMRLFAISTPSSPSTPTFVQT